MKKLSDFKLVTERGQVRPTDFLVIIQSNEYKNVVMEGEKEFLPPNIIMYEGKRYFLALIKGLWDNMIKRSKEFAVGPFEGYEIVFAQGIGENGMMQLIAYPDFESMLKDCSVFKYHKRIDFETDSKTLMDHMRNKTPLKQAEEINRGI